MYRNDKLIYRPLHGHMHSGQQSSIISSITTAIITSKSSTNMY